jgi:hypothetical protein
VGGRSQKEGRRGKREEIKGNTGTFEYFLLTVKIRNWASKLAGLM